MDPRFTVTYCVLKLRKAPYGHTVEVTTKAVVNGGEKFSCLWVERPIGRNTNTAPYPSSNMGYTKRIV